VLLKFVFAGSEHGGKARHFELVDLSEGLHELVLEFLDVGLLALHYVNQFVHS